jgi:predicted DCC family thiol-disulfide oxidoreductase YuxK
MNTYQNKILVVFDGECNLCHWSVKFIGPRDLKKLFCFVPILSKAGQSLLEERSLNTKFIEGVLLIEEGGSYKMGAAAVIQILKQLPYWKWLGMGVSLIPSFITDWVYKIIANKRKKWFGKASSCNRNIFNNICFIENF